MVTYSFSASFLAYSPAVCSLTPPVRNNDSRIFLALLKSLREVDGRRYGDVLSVPALKTYFFHISKLLRKGADVEFGLAVRRRERFFRANGWGLRNESNDNYERTSRLGERWNAGGIGLLPICCNVASSPTANAS